METGITNRVAASSLVTFDLEEYHVPGERVLLDIKNQLYQGLILKEKDFRAFIKDHDWSQYKDKFVAITCTEDAVVPTWAYMLIVSSLQPFARLIIFGSLEELESKIFSDVLSKIDWCQFNNSKVVVKGCSKVNVPIAVYVEATRYIREHASSIMFGEPCSTVPVFKKPK